MKLVATGRPRRIREAARGRLHGPAPGKVRESYPRKEIRGIATAMQLNPFSYEFHEDPYPTYRWLRDYAPLYRNDEMGFWALSRFADVSAAFLDWGTYSSAEGILLERLDPTYLEM